MTNSSGILSGPMAERDCEIYQSVHGKDGAHYNTYKIDHEQGMAGLHEMFPDGEASELNFVLFSTSGVHGSYVTLEEIEESFRQYGENPEWPDNGGDIPDDYHSGSITVLIVHPRLVCLRYGEIKIGPGDIDYLKALRDSSVNAIHGIGR